MGVNDLLPRLPFGKSNAYHQSMYGALEKGSVVPFDAAGALWQFAAKHAEDYLNGNYMPALVEWAHFLQYLRTTCGWILIVIFDGTVNEHKGPENARRRTLAETARRQHKLIGQIKNTPDYIAMAANVCNFLGIKNYIAYEEADPQVVYETSISPHELVPLSGDSDLLVYQMSNSAGEDGVMNIIIMRSYSHELYRVINLNDPTIREGEYPLMDMRKKYGIIVFQLYAGCLGCDFTERRCGIEGIGFEAFMKLAGAVVDAGAALTPKSLADSIWANANDIATKNGFETSAGVEKHLQHIVDIYSGGKVYDEESNVINMNGGRVLVRADNQSKNHRAGKVDPKTREAYSDTLSSLIDDLDCAQLINVTSAAVSTIRGANLPTNKAVADCSVSELRDFIAARGGKISGNKGELIKIVKNYQLIETQVEPTLVHRNPNPIGMLYAKVDTSGTIAIGPMLDQLLETFGRVADVDSGIKSLIQDIHHCFSQGLFEEMYDNIARIAPELKESLIYRYCGVQGSGITQKSIGDALRRCWYGSTGTTYHGIAILPELKKAFLLSKAQASMKRDEKTRKKTPDGEPPKKAEYLVMIELLYRPSDDIKDSHGLGIFTGIGRHYCTNCVAGQGNCRHKAERLWYQLHHWTPERLGIDRPPTMDACSWHPGGNALVSDVRKKIYSQQSVKFELSIEEQKKKLERNAKRDCTEGNSAHYQPHKGRRKQQPDSELQFSAARTEELFRLLREQSND